MDNIQTPPPPPPITPPTVEQEIPARPKTWLVESILATILCCLPIGIVGIVYALRVNSLHDQTEYDKAQKASNNAKRWTLIGVGAGLAYLIFILILGMIGYFSDFNMPSSEGLVF